ncbi:hypothetical protein [uncultured Maricaulis sp.]|uniref:hypothetical protein n=1 Tax=uncultured Maricaulis sp. TaxID=174710 RepID=UPI0026058D3A|nr:hypothetical protein [uncultured Maricaulis sp.]
MSSVRLATAALVVTTLTTIAVYTWANPTPPAQSPIRPSETASRPQSDDTSNRQAAMLRSARGQSSEYDATVDARMQEAASLYVADVDRAVAAIDAYSPDLRALDWDGVVAVLNQLEDWVGVVAQSETHQLNGEELERVNRLILHLARKQRRLLPRLRASLNNIDDFYDGVGCYTTADRDLVAVCSAERFQRSNEIRRFQNRTRSLMRQLRFRQVLYQPHQTTPANYYSDTFDAVEDGAIVMWSLAGVSRRFRD